MKKIILSSIFTALYLFTNAHCCVRCIPDNTPDGIYCWLSDKPCAKQPDGSGGCHCPDNNCDGTTCNCGPLAVGPGGTNVGGPMPFIGNTTLVPMIDNSYNLSLKNLVTGVITYVANVSGIVDNQLFRFELNENNTVLTMKRMTITEDINGNITSQIVNTDVSFPVSL
jgi:hypothetical protein